MRWQEWDTIKSCCSYSTVWDFRTLGSQSLPYSASESDLEMQGGS